MLQTLTPSDWWYHGTTAPRDWHGQAAHAVFGGVVFVGLVCAVAALGSWGTVDAWHEQHPGLAGFGAGRCLGGFHRGPYVGVGQVERHHHP
ncbi:hypothetical protein ACFV0D_38125, partial [Streptomyces sp. NPDC059556]|uniref:hypothetical protein n=1 Tax=Streptomyces sp. NPDC059556 TaxID=3346863 RepID=UPI00368F623D